MVKAMAEQLAAAHAEIKHLRATLEERDNTISQLRQEVQELSQTVGLQAQTLREREAALVAAVRVRAAGGSRPGRRETSCSRGRPARSGGLGGSRGEGRCVGGEGVWVGRRRAPQSAWRGPAGAGLVLEDIEKEVGAGGGRAGQGRSTAGRGGEAGGCERCG